MNFNELKQLLNLLNCDENKTNNKGPYQVGKAYLIRTVTNFWTGRVVAIHGKELVLADAAWIADTGRFNEVFKSGPKEVEPVSGNVIVNREAVVDACEWNRELPREVK